MVAVAPLKIRKQAVVSPPPTPLLQEQSRTTILAPSTYAKRPAGDEGRRYPTARPPAEEQTQAVPNPRRSEVEADTFARALLPPTVYDKGTAMPQEHAIVSRGNIADLRAKPLPDSPGPDLPDKDTPYAVSDLQTQQADESNTLDSISTTIAHQYYPAPVLPRMPANAHLLAAQGQNSNRMLSTASISTTKATRGSPPPPETPLGAQDRNPPQAPAALTPQTYSIHLSRQQQEQGLPHSAQGLHDLGRSPGNTLIAAARARPDALAQSAGTSSAIPISQLEQDLGRMRIEDPAPPAYTIVLSPATSIQEEKAFAADQAEQPLSLQGHPAFLGVQPGTELQSPQPQHLAQQNLPKSPSPPATQSTPPPLPEGWISHLDPKTGQYYYIHLPTQSTQWEFPKGPTPINLPEPQSPMYAGSIYSNSVFDRPLASPGVKPQYATYPPSLYTMTPLASPTAAGFLQPPPSAGLEQFRIGPANGVYFGPYLRYTNMDLENGVWHGSVMLVTESPLPPSIHLHRSVDLSPNPRQLTPNAIHQHQDWTFYRYDIDIRMEEMGDTKWTYAITSHLGCTRYEFVVAGRYDTSWRFVAHSGNDFTPNVSMNERTKLGGLGTMWKDVLQKNQEIGGFHVQLGLGNQIVADRLWKDIPSLRQWIALSGKDNRKNAPWSSQVEDEIRHAYFHYYTSHFDQAHLREAFASIPHILTLDDHEIFEGYGSYPEHLQSSNIFRNIGRIGVESYLLFQHHTTPALLRSPASFATKTSPSHNFDLFTITGTGWHFVKYLGPVIVVIAPDCRSERTLHQVLAGPTYQGLFPKIALLPPCVQHVIWMLPTPIVYPRSEIAESLASGLATGKKIVTGGFNAFGKVTSSVAGIVGAKGIVSEGFKEVKRSIGKGGLMSGVLSPFGEVGGLEEVRDMWTHESKDLERTYLIHTLQTLSRQKAIRMTFLSGGTNCAAAGILHDPNDSSSSITQSTSTSLTSLVSPFTSTTTFQSNQFVHTPSYRTLFALITPPVVNAPPSSTSLRLTFPSPSSTTKPIYIPANGTRSSDAKAGAGIPSDTKEDMLEVFSVDVDGRLREKGREVLGLLGRRGWVCGVGFDPVFVRDAFAGGGSSVSGDDVGTAGMASGLTTPSNRVSWGGTSATTLIANGSEHGSRLQNTNRGAERGRISLAFDFMMQAAEGGVPGGGSATVKYGPVIVPAVEYGR